jgi:hypothetical protein
VAAVLIAALCLLVWRVAAGRWRFLSIALAIQAIPIVFLSAPLQSDGAEVVLVVVELLLLSLPVTAPLVVPAVAIWPSRGKSRLRAVASFFLGLIWLAILHTLLVVGPVWDRWEVCLPPGVYYGRDNGGPSCELGPA